MNKKINMQNALSGLGIGLLCLLLTPQIVSAVDYGSDSSYGACAYGRGCQTPTQTTTPDGLKVSINLTDGQTIPRDGYTVIVTPLNGQGRTFDRVEFYLDGVLVHTATPGSNGTATWEWDPVKFPGKKLTVIVYDADGSRINEEFNLTISQKTADELAADPPATTNSPGDEESPTVFGRLVDQVSNAYTSTIETARQAFRAIPAPVIYGFPYLLLLLLLINMILLLIQSQRELREYHILQNILARGRAVNESKKTLAQLVSHYLRTPLTLMMGGIDMLKQDASVESAIEEFDDLSKRIHLKIEALIADAIETSGGEDEEIRPKTRGVGVWRQPGLFLPLFILPVVLIPFNYVAATAGTFTITQLNMATQLIVYGILVTIIYLVLRQRQLKQRDTEELKDVLAAESAINQSRDNLITNTIDTLQEDLGQIDALLARFSASPAAEFIKNGQDRYKELVSKLRVAARLKGMRSEAPFTATTFNSLVANATAPLQVKANDKHIAINSSGEAPLRIQSVELVTVVLQNLIDNAIAYSDDGGIVEVAQRQEGRHTVISVTDHGVGIEEGKMPMLFQPFTKTEGAEVFTHEGMGFNLYLDKLITEYVGGDIEAVSTPHVATTFSLRLPLGK